MQTKLNITLMVLLMMFPQFVETIYSPALPSLSSHFNIPPEKTYLTISIYFSAFAIGVIFWGIISDYIGRRKAMLGGIIVYALASLLALIAPTFEIVLGARFIAAFGIAVGSVITQTMMRDSYSGQELNKVFSIMGIALSISPVIGLFLGGLIASFLGYVGIFSALALLAIILLYISYNKLPETKQGETKVTFKTIMQVASSLYRSIDIWQFALLIMCFNVLLFSYFTYAPFIFEKAGLNTTIYGYSGVLLALGTFIGSYFNKYCISKGISTNTLIKLSTLLALINSFFVYLLKDSLLFLLPNILIIASFGIAIPNILSVALQNYKSSIGTAGALFGLLYYSLIGLGLLSSQWINNYAFVLLTFSTIALVISFSLKPREMT
ncbi:Bcr/CflA family efflux MFS transporter [Myroides phaeus]|uniref:Bcr/CflA family efflux MFS transporter n=1 Tax=Myroides phaeus TaxID=702745 RepID=UPI0013035154|nr:Bcr/CflA family efflux MFS transporter [Myroides phaeus]